MELKELKKKSEGELQKLLAESREKLRELRFKDANKQLKNVREIRVIRNTIAQVLTLINVLKKSNPVVEIKKAEALIADTVKDKK